MMIPGVNAVAGLHDVPGVNAVAGLHDVPGVNAVAGLHDDSRGECCSRIT